MARYLVACHAGGTMTDVIVVDEDGRSVIGKAPTTPYDESVGYWESLEEALHYMNLDMARDGRKFCKSIETAIYTEKSAKLLYVKSQFGHMQIVTSGKVHPGAAAPDPAQAPVAPVPPPAGGLARAGPQFGYDGGVSCVVLAVPGSEAAADKLRARLDAEVGTALVRHFPDGEIYVRIDSPVAGRDVVLVCGLERPAEKLLPLLFLAATAKDLGARRVGLVAPYLSFMRQDSRFHPGAGITSTYFARLVSGAVDWLVTVDPHLHRWSSLAEIYAIPTEVVRAAPAIAGWVREHVPHAQEFEKKFFQERQSAKAVDLPGGCHDRDFF